MPGWARAWSRPKNGAFVPRVAKYIFRTHSFEFYVADKVSRTGMPHRTAAHRNTMVHRAGSKRAGQSSTAAATTE